MRRRMGRASTSTLEAVHPRERLARALEVADLHVAGSRDEEHAERPKLREALLDFLHRRSAADI